MRGISNEVCAKHGLSVITKQEEKESMTYYEWLAKNKGRKSWQTVIKNDIDHAIDHAFSYGNFLMLLEGLGYDIKRGKYLSVRPMGKERYSRTYKLGDEYTIDAIKQRIMGKDLSISPTIKTYAYRKFEKMYQRDKKKGFVALCYYYMYALNLVETRQAPPRAYKALKEDILKFDEMTRVYDFINDRNLNSIELLHCYKERCNGMISKLTTEKTVKKNEYNHRQCLYSELINYLRFKPAHQMYLDGYTNMKPQSNLFIQAEKVLQSKGFYSDEEMKQLQQDYSNYIDSISK